MRRYCGECKDSPLAYLLIKIKNSHFDNLTRLFRHLRDPYPLPSSIQSQLPSLFPIPASCFSLCYVSLALLVPHAYAAYIFLILATFPFSRYLYQYPLQYCY